MHFHESTFRHLDPTESQRETIAQARAASELYAETLDRLLPDGSDKIHILRVIRTCSMWALEAIMRHVDGTPRTHDNP